MLNSSNSIFNKLIRDQISLPKKIKIQFIIINMIAISK
jgi:hypothetical protein